MTMTRLVYPFLFLFLYLKLQPTQAKIDFSFSQYRREHTPKILSNREISYLAKLSNTNYTEEILDNILIPRIVGTENHERVFEYIVGELRKYNWHVEIDEFKDETPIFGKLTFKNIVGTLNPDAERYLVLACHYDSKYLRNEEFLAATDAAVPCAMLLNLIAVMKNHLEKIRDHTDLSLKLIFFDGEEAIVEWGPKDSLYGARHLAQIYGENHVTAKSINETITDLDKIDVLVLLDLLGGPNPTFYSYIKNTERWYLRLLYAEECLKDLKRLKGRRKDRYFLPLGFDSNMQGDHTPFLKRGVPVLHIISHPFPDPWHTPGDNRTFLDPNTTEDLNKILRVFVTEYLHLPVNV